VLSTLPVTTPVPTPANPCSSSTYQCPPNTVRCIPTGLTTYVCACADGSQVNSAGSCPVTPAGEHVNPNPVYLKLVLLGNQAAACKERCATTCVPEMSLICNSTLKHSTSIYWWMERTFLSKFVEGTSMKEYQRKVAKIIWWWADNSFRG
jgi:hypothetical protein